MQSQYRRGSHRLGDVDEVAHGVVAEIFVSGHVRGIGDRSQQQGVAIGRAASHKLRSNIAACTSAIFHNHGLAQRFLKLDGNAARHDVCGTPRCIAHDQTNGFIGVVGILGMRRESQHYKQNCPNAIHKKAIH